MTRQDRNHIGKGLMCLKANLEQNFSRDPLKHFPRCSDWTNLSTARGEMAITFFRSTSSVMVFLLFQSTKLPL